MYTETDKQIWKVNGKLNWHAVTKLDYVITASSILTSAAGQFFCPTEKQLYFFLHHKCNNNPAQGLKGKRTFNANKQQTLKRCNGMQSSCHDFSLKCFKGERHYLLIMYLRDSGGSLSLQSRPVCHCTLYPLQLFTVCLWFLIIDQSASKITSAAPLVVAVS